MMVRFWNAFTKVTAWPVQKLCFRTKIYCENKAVQGRRFRGPAIVICNHTSVFDFAVLLFVFFSRTVRYQMAELLFDKKPLGLFLRMLGGIRVDRNSHDFGFLAESEEILRRGGAVGVFPESRIPRPEETRPLEFKPSAAYLAMSSGAPVIPVYTNGSYFQKKHASVIIGEPVDVGGLVREELSDRENIDNVTRLLRERIIELGEKLQAYETEKESKTH